jgi:hypothetical protein
MNFIQSIIYWMYILSIVLIEICFYLIKFKLFPMINRKLLPTI